MNDTFTGALGTVQNADSMIDSSTTDNDTANLVLGANYTPSNISNVENVNLTWDAYTTPTYTLTNVSGAQSVTLTSSKVGYLGNAVVADAKANHIIAGAGTVGTLTVTGATSGSQVDATYAASVSVTGTGTGAILNAGSATKSVTTSGFKTATIDAASATTISVTDAGTATNSTSLKTAATATVTNATTGALSLEIANGKTITLDAIGASLAISGDGAAATLKVGANVLNGKTVTNEKTAGSLTVSTSDTNGEDVSAVEANLIQFTGNVNGAITVEDGQVFKFAPSSGSTTTLLNITGVSGEATESVTATLVASTNTAVTLTDLKSISLTAAATATSGTDLTIGTLTTNGSSITLGGTNDVSITTVADSGTDAGTLDATSLNGNLTIGTVAADNNFTVNLGTGNGSVTTAASYTANLAVTGQAGNDTVATGLTTGSVTAVLGDGDNSVTASSITTGTLVVTAGEGDDTVLVDGGTITTGTVNLSLGNGANKVTLIDSGVSTGEEQTIDFTGIAADDTGDITVGGKVVALTTGDDDGDIATAVEAGLDGEELLDPATDEVVTAVAAGAVVTVTFDPADGDVADIDFDDTDDVLDGVPVITESKAYFAAAASTITVTTGSGDDTFTIGSTGGADKITITAGEGDDILILDNGDDTAVDVSSATLTLSDIETIQIDGGVGGNAATFKAAVLSGKTYTIMADEYNAATAFTVTGASTTTTIDLGSLVIDQTLDHAVNQTTINAAAGTSAQTITGTSVKDVITGGSGADVITAGNGKDSITAGQGNDSIDLTETNANQVADLVIFNSAATNGKDTITGFKSGTDELSVLGTDTTVAGTGNAVVDTVATALVSGAAAWVVGAGVATKTTTNADVLIIGTTLSSHGDLDLASDGTELLKALSSTSTAATQLTVNTAADKLFFVAYQDGNAYLFHGDSGAGDTAIVASELKLVAVLNNITASTMVAGDFLVY